VDAESKPGFGVNIEAEDVQTELSKLYTDLSLKEDSLQRLREQVKVTQQFRNELEKESTTIKSDLSKYMKESQSKERDIQNLKDDMLALQIQLNMAEEKLQKTEAENIALVDRWLAKAARDAENMNDANAFLERYVMLLLQDLSWFFC
jgi:chromosome segregation ATPase